MIIPVEVTNPKTNKFKIINFLIDTGADISAICILHAESLGLKSKGFRGVLDADGDPINAPVYDIDIDIGGCRLKHVEMVGLNLTSVPFGGLVGNNILNKGTLVGDTGSWSFSIEGETCALGINRYYLLAGVFGLVAGITGTLLLTRK